MVSKRARESERRQGDVRGGEEREAKGEGEGRGSGESGNRLKFDIP